jgi:ABC-type lipoprotein release transport system permease subunit
MNVTGVVTRLAWRNLWRNHRRTLIMLGAITIGIWAMMFMTSLLRGMVIEMIRDGIEGLPGHVQIHHRDYRDDPSVVNFLMPVTGKLQVLLDSPEVVAWTERVRVPAVISSERESRGITLVGIDPATEPRISFLGEDIAVGRFLDGVDDSGVLIGRKLADTLETGLGKRIVLMSQDPDNEIVDRGFRIVGVFEAAIENYEEQFVFTGRSVAQSLLRIDNHVQEIAILGSNFRDSEQLLEKIRAVADARVRVEAWFELDVYLGTMLGVMDGFVLVWIVVVFLALSFGLVNTLVMAVFERVREIGLMLALGMKPAVILAQILVESVMLLIIGLVCGNVLALLTVYGLRDGIDISMVAEGMEMFGSAAMLYPRLTADDMIMANSVVILLGIVASFSPAWRASRYEPIEAISKV